jgi:hypothetical protein
VISPLLIRRIPPALIIGLASLVLVHAQEKGDEKRLRDIRRTPTLAPDSAHILPRPRENRPLSTYDSLMMRQKDTAAVRRDSTVIDSIRVRFIPGMGSLTGLIDTTSELDRRQFLVSDAKYVGELIWKIPGFFWRDLGEDGKWEQLYALGEDGRGIGILLDGRPMNDPITGTYNLDDMPLEFVDNAELLDGSSSTLASSNAMGAAINFVSRSYNSYRPLTKLRYVQDPKETLLTDGLFTQNIARGLNLMIGFQRNVSQGRYINAALDAWNVRTRLRYDISTRLNISFMDFYTKANNGLNGGISSEQAIDIGVETSDSVISTNGWDLRSRRDVTLSAIARPFADSASATQLSLYYSSLDREYGDPPNSLHSSFIHDFTAASFRGVRLQQHIDLAPVALTIGAQAERRHCDSARVLPAISETEQTGFAYAQIRLANFLTPSVSFRRSRFRGDDITNLGAGAVAAITGWFDLFADVLWADRPPTIQEAYWTDSTLIRPASIGLEHHQLIQCGINIGAGSNFQLRLSGFQRRIRHAILYSPARTDGGTPAVEISNVDLVTVEGLNGRAMVRLGPIEALGMMTLSRFRQGGILETPIPDLLLSAEISYRNLLLKGKLDLKLGMRTQFFNRESGMQLNPELLSYVQYKINILGRSTNFDLFTVAKIGNAYVSISWDNIFNTTYVLAPIYPIAGRHFRIGVNWIFMD